MGEVKRVFHKKMWILIAVAVLGNLCLFLYSELAGRSFTEMFFVQRAGRQKLYGNVFCGGTVSEAG